MRALSEAGFETRVRERIVLDEALAREKKYFAAEFRDRPDRELRVGAAILISRKSPGPS